jgi:hypothetical protein
MRGGKERKKERKKKRKDGLLHVRDKMRGKIIL